MPPADSQAFLRELDKKLWTAADRLRSNLDAAVYKHAVLGLIFLKYVSDSFAQRQAEIEAMLKDPDSDYFISPKDYGNAFSEEYADAIRQELEERDYYIEKNVFWVPQEARWSHLQANAKQPTIGKLVDDAMDALERDNPRLKGALNKNYGRADLDKHRLGELIDLIGSIELGRDRSPSGPPAEDGRPGGPSLPSFDILGRVFESFLTQFASAEGKNGGQWSGATWAAIGSPEGWRGGANQFYTPSCVVRLLVEMLAPYKGRIYDPACGSGGMFASLRRPSGVRFARRKRASARGIVQSEKFVESHGGKLGDISIYGQEQRAWGARFGRSERVRRVRLRRKRPNQSNPTTRRLAIMNHKATMAAR